MAERTPDYDLTPGALLRRSRQRYGWSVEDVADELKLLPYVVEAIEQDNYSQMAGWTYAVGYLRGYAKLVGVNIESAIAENATLLPQKENAPGTLTYRTGMKVAIPISLTWVMTAVVVIVVVGGVSATYWKRANDADRVVLESIVSEEQPTPVQKLPEIPKETPVAAVSDEISVASIEVQSDVAGQQSHVNQDPLAASGQMRFETESNDASRIAFEANIEDSVLIEVVDRQLSLADIDTRIIGSLSAAAVDDMAASSAPLKEVETSSGSELGFDTEQAMGGSELYVRALLLLFDQSSWADVRDAGGRQLLRESVRAGTRVQLEGDPPFTVFVGNARGVRYVYLGEEKTAPVFGEGLFGRFQVGVSD